MEKYKQDLLNSLRNHIVFIQGVVREKLVDTRILANRSLKELGRMKPEDQPVYMNLRAAAQTRVVELEHLEGSPYFNKFKIVDEKNEEKEFYISKHQLSEENIYSWVSPVAAIRFENPGEASYKLPDGTNKNIFIKEKEQHLIVGGNVIFFSREELDKPRDLIYQEHFTKQKSDFALPEIVAQIEKAQDQVIRASHRGPLVISGPAGSGKTTLALHRVAYLTQAPDTSEFYPPESIIVFVQDMGTKKYFSTLLPGLGINNVEITTFYEWAMMVLDLKEYSYIDRYGEDEEQKDLYEYQKLQALRSNPVLFWNKNIFKTMISNYSNYLSADNLKLFEKQKKEKKLDRFDLVFMLRAYLEKNKNFETKRGYQTFVKDKIVSKIEKKKVLYSLIIVDEFQNYLPEQLHIMKVCLDKDTNSTVYVGDIAQQVKLGTLKKLEDFGETIQPDRNIRLNKVYRNTKNILSFIQGLGYKVEIPDGIKEGPSVVEKIINSKEEEISYIKENIKGYENGSIGIISKDESYLDLFKKEFDESKNIHVLTMYESQGVEFDLVFIVGVKEGMFNVTHHIDVSPEHIEERKKIQKDLLYVSLTRAITELHITGVDKLCKIC